MLTMLAGLPGSGKTTFSKSRGSAAPGTRIYADFLGGRSSLAPDTGLFSLLADVQAGRTLFADEIFLCRPDYRAMFMTLLAPFVPPGYRVEWIYFANSPEICLRNVQLRTRSEPVDVRRNAAALEWVQKLPPLYHIPEGVEPIPVVDYAA